jgi:hypothetical protein
VVMVLRAKVASSASSERKLCTGNPSSVRPVICLVTAVGERCDIGLELLRARPKHPRVHPWRWATTHLDMFIALSSTTAARVPVWFRAEITASRSLRR